MDYGEMEDQVLLELLREDDELAFKEIYGRFHDFIYTYAFRLTGGNEQESQDILQTLFINLWSKRNSLNISGKLFYYLNQSVRYGFLNQERNRANLSRYQASLLHYINEGHADTDEHLFEKELSARLRKLAEGLPGKGGSIFLLYHFEHYSHAQIAETLGISQKTVKNLLSRSTKDIRLKLGLKLVLQLLLS